MPRACIPGGAGKPGGGYPPGAPEGDAGGANAFLPGGCGIALDAGPGMLDGDVLANAALNDALFVDEGCVTPKPPGAVIGGCGGGGGAMIGGLPEGRLLGPMLPEFGEPPEKAPGMPDGDVGIPDGERSEGGGALAAGSRVDGGTGGGALTRLTLGGLALAVLTLPGLPVTWRLGPVLVLGVCEARSPGRVGGSSLFLSKRCVASSSSSQSISSPGPLPAAGPPLFATLSVA